MKFSRKVVILFLECIDLGLMAFTSSESKSEYSADKYWLVFGA